MVFPNIEKIVNGSSAPRRRTALKVYSSCPSGVVSSLGAETIRQSERCWFAILCRIKKKKKYTKKKKTFLLMFLSLQSGQYL